MKKNKKRQLLAAFLALCVFTGNISVLAAENDEEIIPEEEKEIHEEDFNGVSSDAWEILDEEESEKEAESESTEAVITDENLNITDEESVKKDADALNLGFLKCVSRNLNFETKGEFGSRIFWKSSHPHIISNDGKFTAPKKITDVTITATVTKGKSEKVKEFVATVNNRSMYDVILDYVDTMCEYGRDTKYFTPEEYANGNRVESVVDAVGRNTIGRRSGLFFGMLNRDTLQYPAHYVTEWPRATYNSDERSSGCEVSPEVYLYEIMCDLTAMTGDEKYEDIVDEIFAFWLEHLIHPDNGILLWGAHMVYDPITASFNFPNQYATHEQEVAAWQPVNEPDFGLRYAMRIPFIIHKMFEINPESTHQHFLSWYRTALANYKDFSFGRHTNLNGAGSVSGNYLTMLNPMLYAYAWGYHYTGDPQFMEALNSLMNWLERLAGMNDKNVVTQELYYGGNRPRSAWMGNQLEAAVMLTEVMPLVPENIRERMERFIEKTDKYFVVVPEKGKKSFIKQVYLRTGQISQLVTATDAEAYIKRWQCLPEGEFKEKMTLWLTDWADKYGFDNLENRLSESEIIPVTFAKEMTYFRKLYEGTGNEKYLDRALELADFAIYDLWQMEGLLPAMTHATKKYYDVGSGNTIVVGEIWKTYFDDVERNTGVHPVNEAWKKSGNMTKQISDYATDKELYEKTKFEHKIGGVQNED